MRKRRVYLILGCVAVVLAGVLVAVIRREREPEYGGKRLSEWVDDYITTSRGEKMDVAAAFAREGIRHIGTNAIPFLLEWARYESPPWKYKLYGALNSMPMLERFRYSWALTDAKAIRSAERAMWSFGVLGHEAHGAVPALAQIAMDPKATESAVIAVHCLGSIGKASVPALLALLTNQQAATLRIYVVHDLALMGTNALRAVSALQKVLSDPDLSLRQYATNALQRIDPAAFPEVNPGPEDAGKTINW